MSRHFFFLLYLHLFLIFLKSNGQDANSLAGYCHEHHCGGVPVRYPFWRLDNTTTTSSQYCGYPGFGINCSTSTDPIFYLSDDAYFVKNISYGDYTLTLVDIDVTINVNCPRARHNLTLGTLPLNYSTIDLNLTFYFNCSSGIAHGNLIPCLGLDENESYIVKGVDEPEGFDWFDVCAEKVVATVIEREFVRGFGVAMNEGFVLDWQTARECGQCEESDGRCGYNNATRENICFCNDGTILKDHCRKESLLYYQDYSRV